MPSYLVKELFKFAIFRVRLPLSPGRSGGGFLEAPVGCKDVVEEDETVFSSPHLKDLPQQTATLIVIDRCQPPIFGLTWVFLVNPNPMNLSSKAGVFARET